jgi:hypothetical protein
MSEITSSCYTLTYDIDKGGGMARSSSPHQRWDVCGGNRLGGIFHMHGEVTGTELSKSSS